MNIAIISISVPQEDLSGATFAGLPGLSAVIMRLPGPGRRPNNFSTFWNGFTLLEGEGAANLSTLMTRTAIRTITRIFPNKSRLYLQEG